MHASAESVSIGYLTLDCNDPYLPPGPTFERDLVILRKTLIIKGSQCSISSVALVGISHAVYIEVKYVLIFNDHSALLYRLGGNA